MFNKISEKNIPEENPWQWLILWNPHLLSLATNAGKCCSFPPRFAAAQIDVTHRPHYRPWSHHSHTPRVEFLPIQIGKIKLLIQLNRRNFHVLTQDAPFVIKLRNRNPGWSRRPCENTATVGDLLIFVQGRVMESGGQVFCGTRLFLHNFLQRWIDCCFVFVCVPAVQLMTCQNPIFNRHFKAYHQQNGLHLNINWT